MRQNFTIIELHTLGNAGKCWEIEGKIFEKVGIRSVTHLKFHQHSFQLMEGSDHLIQSNNYDVTL